MDSNQQPIFIKVAKLFLLWFFKKTCTSSFIIASNQFRHYPIINICLRSKKRVLLIQFLIQSSVSKNVWYKFTKLFPYKKIKFINILFFYITFITIFAYEQILLVMKAIKNFLKKCTARLDQYNMNECVSILTDDQGGEVARIDHNNSKITCEPSIWIGENERVLTEKEIDYIIDYLLEETEDELREWNTNYNDNYDVRDEQGLYGCGY